MGSLETVDYAIQTHTVCYAFSGLRAADATSEARH